MEDLQEYVVTLKNYEDLDDFYNDMETPGGNLYIPNRAVDVAKRRPGSRNTHYMLTFQEAEQVRNDPRVLSVELVAMVLAGIRPMYEQTGLFDKSNVTSADYLNWGLLRCIEGEPRANWGANGTPTQTGTIKFNATGKNVDVIIVDGHFDPSHPEYARNPDGSGGSRVIQYDWNLLSPLVSSLDNDAAPALQSTYVYTPYVDPNNSGRTSDNDHGSHVAGTACGNTQGWARDANIYNINPYGTNPNTMDVLVMWDYIRAFHKYKQINPITKRKNPTICNCSYGAEYYFPYNYGSFTTGKIIYVNNRGNTVLDANGLTAQQLTDFGIRVETPSNIARIPYYSFAIAADVQDAINDGIIVVAAAGNSYSKIDVTTGPDYNNFMNASYAGQNLAWAIHRGTAPGSVPGVICVGSTGENVSEAKSGFSNCGPRIDIYAPGSNINSVYMSVGVPDARNNNYLLRKISGTSMASPQVAGIAACVAELYPDFNQQQMYEYLTYYSKKNQMTDTGGGQADITSLQGSNNRLLYANKERPDSGDVYPKKSYFVRPTTGRLYPRVKTRR